MKRAFSLIELLVVIAIIGILISIGAVSYLTAQKQVRDTRRKADLAEIRQALETYRAENGTYPSLATWTSDLAPNYITTIPTDPTGTSYSYAPGSSPIVSYTLCANLEIIPSTPDNSCGSSYNYAVNNP